ncbi:MAG: tRNA lysidine(34) synthetase TilS [Rhizomicrobium sp.]
MQTALAAGAPWPGAVAVSGGGDSTALMVLVARWAKASGRCPPHVLTIDHRLYPESSRHAAAVVTQANALGLEAHVLEWQGRKPVSDIENAARAARYGLMGDWCRDRRVESLYLGHTLEDQAETFLLRLARGSGVDGLAAMSPVSGFPEPGYETVRLVRPLLAVPRARLRALLLAERLTWHEDPMNADPRFARARLRMAWPGFVQVGLSAKRIAEAAGHLARARMALDHEMEAFLARASREHKAGVLLDGSGLAAIPYEIGLRVLARVLMQVSRHPYRPRMARLEALMTAIRTAALGKGRTLHGCSIRPASLRDTCFGPQTLWIAPEPARRRMVGNRET